MIGGEPDTWPDQLGLESTGAAHMGGWNYVGSESRLAAAAWRFSDTVPGRVEWQLGTAVGPIVNVDTGEDELDVEEIGWFLDQHVEQFIEAFSCDSWRYAETYLLDSRNVNVDNLHPSWDAIPRGDGTTFLVPSKYNLRSPDEVWEHIERCRR